MAAGDYMGCLSCGGKAYYDADTDYGDAYVIALCAACSTTATMPSVIRADERQKVLAEIQQHVHIAGTRQFALFYLENCIRDMAASTDNKGDGE